MLPSHVPHFGGMMLRLRMFGGLALVDASGSAAIHQRLRLGVLAVLALAGERGLTRDRLRLLFWPESSDENARHGLDQLLYTLRQQVGDTAFIGTDPVRLNPAVIVSDVQCFEAALAREDFAEAVAQYAGPFADGFYIRDAADFERWTEQQRGRLSSEYRRALERLAMQMAHAGRAAEEIALRRRLVAEDPLNEAATAELVRSLARAGDRGEALRQARVYNTLARDELGLAPNPIITALASEVPSSHAVQGNGEQPAAILPRPSVSASRPRRRPNVAARRWTLGILTTVSTLILIGAMLARTRQDQFATAGTAPSTMLIAPFRVTGADSSLRYLAEGMIDLLAVTLTGEGGPRAVDPRTALSLWRRIRLQSPDEPTLVQISRAARQLGASQVLLGEVVGVPTRLIVSASVLRVADEQIVTRIGVAGPQDSLRALVDALAAQVLTSTASNRTASELSASLPALRAYLQGESAYRGGRYVEAAASFQRALTRDSAFAIAALGLAMSVGWTPSAEDDGPGVLLAYALRQRLSPKDQALLGARVGRPFLAASSTRDKLVSKEVATRLAPDRAEAWFWLGDDLFHEGALVGDTGARLRSLSLFRHSLELDSASASLGHLVELAAASGDSAEATRLAALFLRRDPTGDLSDFIRWRVAVMAGDGRALGELRRRFTEMETSSLLHILTTMQYDAVGLEDVDRVVAALRRSSLERAEQRAVSIALWELELNRGRPVAALAASRMWRAAASDRTDTQDREYNERIIGDALFADGDSTAADASARALAAFGMMTEATRSTRVASSVCAVHLWRLAQGDTLNMTRAIRFLLAVAAHPDSAVVSSQSRLCAVTLQMLLVSLTHDSAPNDVVPHLDSLLLTGPVAFPVMGIDGANVAIIGPLLARRDVTAALAASRRHLYGRGPLRTLAILLAYEGRVSAMTGDTAGAIRAYRHYLALREDAEPSYRRKVDQIRSELARLQPMP